MTIFMNMMFRGINDKLRFELVKNKIMIGKYGEGVMSKDQVRELINDLSNMIEESKK